MKNYFQQLYEETSTKFWINNPTGSELNNAMNLGAFSCTTNPAYCSRLINQEPEFISCIIDEIITKEKDNDKASVQVYQAASKRLIDKFLPLYIKSNGIQGFVTIQDDPRRDEETKSIVKTAMENRKLGKNFMAKIPVIKGGIEAIEVCLEEDIPVCATEVFAISQAITVCELYEKVCRRTGKRPAFFVTHISGIFDEYLGKVATRENIPIVGDLIGHAGIAIARKEYDILRKQGYKVVLLGGGARDIHHFTGLVGGNAHITINWSTANELIESNIAVESRIEARTEQRYIDELSEKFSDFKRAYNDEGLEIKDYADFGPVQLFRNAFLKGWYLLLAEIATRRHLSAI